MLRVLNRLILRACQPDPKQRFADAEEMLGQWAAAETEEPRHHARVRRRILLAIGCLLAAIVMAAVRFWPSQTPVVDVSFITEPFGATIYLDGKLLLQPNGTPYTTPCTVPGVPARSHRVSFSAKMLPIWMSAKSMWREFQRLRPAGTLVLLHVESPCLGHGRGDLGSLVASGHHFFGRTRSRQTLRAMSLCRHRTAGVRECCPKSRRMKEQWPNSPPACDDHRSRAA